MVARVVGYGRIVAQLVDRTRTEREVGQRPGLFVGRVRGAGGRQIEGLLAAFGEKSFVGVGAELRMRVADDCGEVLILVAELQAVLAAQQGVVDLGVDRKGIDCSRRAWGTAPRWREPGHR